MAGHNINRKMQRKSKENIDYRKQEDCDELLNKPDPHLLNCLNILPYVRYDKRQISNNKKSFQRIFF